MISPPKKLAKMLTYLDVHDSDNEKTSNNKWIMPKKV